MKYATPEAYEYGRAAASLAETLSSAASHFFAIVKTWRQRSRTRAQLAEASPEILDDIGLTRFQAIVESEKRFWEE